MSLFLPQRWRQQPQGPASIDWSNPLTRGLLVARLPNDNPQGGLILAPAGAGRNGAFTTSSGVLSTNAAVGSASFSFLVLFKTAATLTGIQSLLGRGQASSPNNTGFGFNVSHDNVSYSGAFYAGSAYTIIGKPAGTLSVNTEYCIAATFDGSSGRGYSNGVRTVGPTSVTGINTTSRLTLNNSSNLLEPSTSAVYVVLYWTRALGDAEVAAVSANPWQLFRPLRPIIYSISNANAAPTLSLATVTDITSTSARPRVTVTFS